MPTLLGMGNLFAQLVNFLEGRSPFHFSRSVKCRAVSGFLSGGYALSQVALYFNAACITPDTKEQLAEHDPLTIMRVTVGAIFSVPFFFATYASYYRRILNLLAPMPEPSLRLADQSNEVIELIADEEGQQVVAKVPQKRCTVTPISARGMAAFWKTAVTSYQCVGILMLMLSRMSDSHRSNVLAAIAVTALTLPGNAVTQTSFFPPKQRIGTQFTHQCSYCSIM